MTRNQTIARVLVVGAAWAASVSCGNELVRQGRAASFLSIEVLEGASGATPTTFAGSLPSDVLTIVEQQVDTETVRVPTIYEDSGRVGMRLGLKDPGTSTAPNSPTSANYITVTRYHVQYRRADGRNTPGVDVPYPFDGGVTFTVREVVAATFTLVRAQAKMEPPLIALRNGGGAIQIGTIADVTFYGHDQTGAAVSVTGSINVNFADWGDPR